MLTVDIYTIVKQPCRAMQYTPHTTQYTNTLTQNASYHVPGGQPGADDDLAPVDGLVDLLELLDRGHVGGDAVVAGKPIEWMDGRCNGA